MSKSLDIVKSRRQDSIIYMILAIILIVSGFIIIISKSGDTSIGMVPIAIGVTVAFFAITTAQAVSSTMEYRDLAILMGITMKKIDNLERKLDEILKNLKKKES